MATTVLSQRSGFLTTFNANTINYSTLTGSSIVVSTIIVQSTINFSTIFDSTLISQNIFFSTLNGQSTTVSSITLLTSTISLGTSTNSLYTTLANGAVSTAGSWITSLSMINGGNVTMTGNAQTQVLRSQVSTLSSLMITTNSGQTWSTFSGGTGLPSDQTAVRSTFYNTYAMSETAQYQLTTAAERGFSSGGSLYVTSTFGASWSNPNPNTGTPYIYLPFENSIADVNNRTTMTATIAGTGTISYVAGKVGNNAISFGNVAGSSSTTNCAYLISGSSALSAAYYSVSFWFNAQASAATAQILFSSNGQQNVFYINPSNQFGVNINGGMIGSTTTISLNTWNHCVAVFQPGICSVILNGTLVGSLQNVSGMGTPTRFTVAGSDSTLGNLLFNGYIDDLKIFTTTPPPIYLPFDSVPADNSLDTTGQTRLTVVGPITTVAGIVGANAINFTNTPTGIATQYIRGLWIPPTNFTWDFWFYTPSSGVQQNIIFTCSGSTGLYIQTDNKLYWYVNGTNIPASNGYPIATNTWYRVTAIFQGGSTGYLYVNNALWASGTCPANAGTSTGYFTLSGVDAAGGSQAFNGYIDDLKIYNYAITPSPMVPMNYNNVAISSNGQYMLATASGAGLYMSSNAGQTWSQVSSVALNAAWQGLAISASGQYMMTTMTGGFTSSPQLADITSSLASTTTASWVSNGVTWIGKASTVLNSSYPITNMFNTLSNNVTWAPSVVTELYGNNPSSPRPYIGTADTTTTISGVGAIKGAWVQIQSSVPLIISSYSFSCGNRNQIPHTYYIVGSNDSGTTWFPIHYATANTTYIAPPSVGTTAGSPFVSADFVGPTSNLLVNVQGLQTISYSSNNVSVATTTYATTTNKYTWFRMVMTHIYDNGGVVELGEWGLSFTGETQNYSTTYGSSWTTVTTFPNRITIRAISGNGQYAISTDGQTAYMVSNFLAGFSTNTFTTLTLPSINASITSAAISYTGQFMVLTTSGTSNNVYYSSNSGTTFVAITVGAAGINSSAIAQDGSYITVASGAVVYMLNNIQTGYSVAIGNQAGYLNQARNTIAIGNQAGQQNQLANSIVLNGSAANVTAFNSGFFAAPIGTAMTTPFISVMGYGTDNQIVQSNGLIVILPNGNVGVGTTNPTALLQVVGTIAASGKTFDIPHPLYPTSKKHLVHSSIEAPRCDLIYRGVATLVNGIVQVDINKECTSNPANAMDEGTFEVLCTNPQILLQNMTGLDRVIGSISGSILTITSIKPPPVVTPPPVITPPPVVTPPPENTSTSTNESPSNEPSSENTTDQVITPPLIIAPNGSITPTVIYSNDTISWLVIAERADPYIKEWNRTDENGFLITQYTTTQK